MGKQSRFQLGFDPIHETLHMIYISGQYVLSCTSFSQDRDRALPLQNCCPADCAVAGGFNGEPGFMPVGIAF